MVVCVKCDKSITDSKEVLTCNDCKQSFHPTCSRVGSVEKLKKFSAARKLSWKCDSCVGESLSNVSESSKHEDEGNESKLMSFLQDMRNEFSGQFSNVQSSISEVNTQLVTINGRMDGFNEAINHLKKENEERKNESKNLQEENTSLKEQLQELKNEFTDLQQYTRRNNVEIAGIPTTRDEDIYAVLKGLANYIGIAFKREEISVAHRLPVRRSNGPEDRGRVPSIIVSFISRTTKEAWRNAAKGKKLYAEELHSSLPPGRIFINDHLSPHNKAVLGKARRLVREKKLAGAWSWDCRVLVKWSAEERPFRVWALEDLDRQPPQHPK